MKISVPASVEKIIEILRKNGFEAYAVGGCVRDSILGKHPNDWDITTNALAEDIKKCFSDFRILDTGLKHGTVTVVLDDENYEITTYRIDGEYKDNRRPEKVYFTSSLKEDLARRDFTVNAMAFGGEDIIDLYGGLDDLKSGIIRCVGDADRRFGEDSLRIMRALRFASVLGFSVENNTAESIRRNYALLKNISAERIFSELKKLLCGFNVYEILTDFSEVFAFMIPEISACIDCEQNTPYHNGTVWKHTAASVAASPAEIEIRLAMLFHDLGKPLAATADENGVSHFYGHAEQSRLIAERNLKRFKCSNSIFNSVVQLVSVHDFPAESKKSVKKLMAKLSAEQMTRFFAVQRADTAAQSDYMRKEKLDRIDRAESTYFRIIEDESCFDIKSLDINGHDLIKLGIPQGKEIGRILNELLDLVINDKIPNENLKLAAKALDLFNRHRMKVESYISPP